MQEQGGQPRQAETSSRSRWRIGVILAALAVAVAVVLPSIIDRGPPPTPSVDELGPFPTAEVDTTEFDITLGINPSKLPGDQLGAALDLAQEANVTQVQSGATWWYLNRGREPRDYDWTNLDRLLEASEERGIRVVLQLSGTPAWVHGGDPGESPTREEIWTPPVASEEQLDHWGDFVADVVDRYGDRVALYELWNEPNGQDFWYPEPNPADFGALLRTGYLRAKDTDPDVLIGSGGLSRNDVGYLETLYESIRETYPDAEPNGHFFDVLGVHPYSRDVSPTVVTDDLVTESTFGVIDENFIGFTRMHDVLAGYGEEDKPIYLGEYGFSTTQTWMDPVDDATRAEHLTDAFEIAVQYPYVIALTWYDFLPTDSNEGWAIVEEDGRPMATFEALRNVELGPVSAAPWASERGDR
jgi:hypothetical protein